MDAYYMKRAITLAERGRGLTSPKPLSGAVIVKDGNIIGEGFYAFFGARQAEQEAILNLKESAKGGTIYLTLEPGNCREEEDGFREAILRSGIGRIVLGSRNPVPSPDLSTLETLKASGIEVREGVLKAECDRLNEIYLHYKKMRRPFVVMAYASTLDGKTASVSGEIRGMSGEASMRRMHEERNLHPAVLVGIGTVLRDNPALTCRIEGGKNPARVICDTSLKIPLDSAVVKGSAEVPTFIACARSEEKKKKALEEMGVKVLVVPERKGFVDLPYLMDRLGSLEMDSILLEGGGTLNWSALESRIVNKVQIYLSPRIFGGSGAKTGVEGEGFTTPLRSVKILDPQYQVLDDDLLIEGHVEYPL